MSARFLPFDEIRFIKSISVEDKLHEEPFFGEIIYVRKASEHYWYKPIPENLTWQERFERDVNGRPEDEYPSDLLDKLILKGVRTVYPHATIITKGVNFDIERDEYKKYLSIHKEVKQGLVISPTAAGLTIGDLERYAGKEYAAYNRPLSLYYIGEKALDVFMNKEYHIYYPLSIASDVEELLKIYDQEIFDGSIL